MPRPLERSGNGLGYNRCFVSWSVSASNMFFALGSFPSMRVRESSTYGSSTPRSERWRRCVSTASAIGSYTHGTVMPSCRPSRSKSARCILPTCGRLNAQRALYTAKRQHKSEPRNQGEGERIHGRSRVRRTGATRAIDSLASLAKRGIAAPCRLAPIVRTRCSM